MDGTFTYLPTAQFNFASDGITPVPKQIPQGSEILSQTTGKYIYRTPDGDQKTLRLSDSVVRQMYANFNALKKNGELQSEGQRASDTTTQNTTAELPPVVAPIVTGMRGSKNYDLRADGNWYTPDGQMIDMSTQSQSMKDFFERQFRYARQDYGADAFNWNPNTASTTTNAQANVDNTTNVPDAVIPQSNVDVLKNSDAFKNLPADQQEVVKQVYELIASNNKEQAGRLAAAFKTSAEISDPFFKQELRLAVDAIERGFVSIDNEEEFKLKQLQRRKSDLEQDLATQKDFLSLEEQSALRQIDREFSTQLKTTRQALASRGFSSSSRRDETEQLLEESTGDLRESTKRKFGLQQTEIARSLERGQRDTTSEIDRLKQLTNENKLDFLRTSEAKVGTANLPNLPSLNSTVSPLGDIVGDIPQRQTQDIITGAQNLIF